MLSLYQISLMLTALHCFYSTFWLRRFARTGKGVYRRYPSMNHLMYVANKWKDVSRLQGTAWRLNDIYKRPTIKDILSQLDETGNLEIDSKLPKEKVPILILYVKYIHHIIYFSEKISVLIINTKRLGHQIWPDFDYTCLLNNLQCK